MAQRPKFISMHEAPSHMLADGTMVFLPPPTDREKSFCFAECVARHHLLDDEEMPRGEGGEDYPCNYYNKDEDLLKSQDDQQQQQQQQDRVADSTFTKIGVTNKNEKNAATRMIHPLAMASAQLQTSGISELSKVINLSSLVDMGEYFGFAHVMSRQMDGMGGVAAAVGSGGGDGTSSAAGGGGAVRQEGNASTSSATATVSATQPSTTSIPGSVSQSNRVDHSDVMGNSAKIGMNASVVENVIEDSQEPNLRAQFVLYHKRKQFDTATSVLLKHRKRLKVITAAQQVLDRRYLQLRQRWKLSAPKHSSVVLAPLQPNETIAIDVDVYHVGDRKRKGQKVGVYGGNKGIKEERTSGVGKIARMVPRFATIELAKSFGVQQLLKVISGSWNDASKTSAADWTIAKPLDYYDASRFDDLIAHRKQKNGQEDDWDSDRVPKLTLFLEIEKATTGFVHSVALSSDLDQNSLGMSMENDKENTAWNMPMAMDIDGPQQEVQHSANDSKMNNFALSDIVKEKIGLRRDEQSIQSLQHSLYCAQVFDSIRREVIDAVKTHSGIHTKPQQVSQVAWLSSEMEDNFFPAPSFMAGGGDVSSVTQEGSGFDVCPLSVIYCHEGEVKVQLNSEYALKVRLVDTQNSREMKRTVNGKNSTPSLSASEPINVIHDYDKDMKSDSGSQSREQIDILCRLLLLHAQFVFHDHHKRSLDEGTEEDNGDGSSSRIDYSAGMVRKPNVPRNPLDTTQRDKHISPHILQSCIALGSKVLFERQVRNILEALKSWQKENFPMLKFAIEWLPLSTFDSHAQFAIALDDFTIIDVHISGSTMTATSFTENGDYRSVNFGSAWEFELYMKLIMNRMGMAKN